MFSNYKHRHITYQKLVHLWMDSMEGRIVKLQTCSCYNLRTCESIALQEKMNLAEMTKTKDFEMGRLSWIFQLSPIKSQKSLRVKETFLAMIRRVV